MTSTEKRSLLIPADWVPGPKQGEWTYDSYAALPDDGQRYELVNGVLLMAPAPSWSHQETVGEIFAYLRDYVRTTGLGGAFTAPIDVELTRHTVVQPDVVVLLKTNRERLRGRHIVGAPDLVVEVASQRTQAYDRLSKYDAYARAGVPEYWLVYPKTKSVEVLVLEVGKYSSLGLFRGKEKLPSHVLPGFPVEVELFFVSVWS
jgi:Uma2 family endonuclease